MMIIIIFLIWTLQAAAEFPLCNVSFPQRCSYPSEVGIDNEYTQLTLLLLFCLAWPVLSIHASHYANKERKV